MKMTQLSVSSVILAAVLSGCSQQHITNGSGSSQSASSQQIEGGSQHSSSQQELVVAPKPVAPVKKPVVKKFLPAAKPGQCFAKVKIPPRFVNKTKRILLQKASSQRVLVRAPQYRWISKKVLVQKSRYTNHVIPAQYTNKTKRILVKPAYNKWQKGKNGPVTRIDNMTGEIYCRVTVPAQYKTITQRVQVRPAQNVRRFIPAVYKTVKQKQRVSGALYKTVNRPARYKTQNYRVQVAGARYVWRPVVCAPKQVKHVKKIVAPARRTTYRKPTLIHRPVVVHRPVKRVHKKHYKRPVSHNNGISYAEYRAVMNASHPNKRYTKSKSGKVINPANLSAMTKAKVKTKTKVKSSTKKASIQKNIVYGIQSALKSKGFNPGSLDGKMGAKTAKALKAFQSSRGLPVGVLSKDTFRALGLVK